MTAAALPWLAATVLAERGARRACGSRAAGWLLAYPLLAAPAALAAVRARTLPDPRPPLPVGLGLVLVLAGYQAGRIALGDRPDRPPPDAAAVEAFALAAVVAPVEELLWGAVVERRSGPWVTAVAFALKHGLVDGRWRRVTGLAAFWLGLASLRARSPGLACVVHGAVNAAGVAIGHRRGLDQF